LPFDPTPQGGHVDPHDGIHAKALDGPEIDPVRGRAEAAIGGDIIE
jgi:hypothetical protein